MELPRADSGTLMFTLKLPTQWTARIANFTGREAVASEGKEILGHPTLYTRGVPAFYELTGPSVTLSPNQGRSFAVVIAFGLLHHFGINYLDQLVNRTQSLEAARESPGRAWEEAKERWNAYFSSLPAPHLRFPGGDQLYWMCFYTLKRNLYAPDWDFHYLALFEGKGWYDAVWQWSVAPFDQLVLLQLDPELAEEQTYFFTENALPTGMIPEHVFNTFVPTDTIHPQLLAYGAWLVFLHTHDRGYLERIYWPLARHFDWLYAGGIDTAGNVRDKDRDAIFEWGSQPWDDGLDNDVRSDPGLDRFEAIDLNAYVLLSEKCLVRMAEELGMPAEAARWRSRAKALAKGIVERFYDPDSNMFWDCYYDTHRPFKVLAFYNFLPLLAGVPLETSKREQMLRNYLLSPNHFWGKLPFPSLAFSDPHYSPTNYMRGPVWPAPVFLLIMTLWKNGLHREADVAARQFLETVSRWRGIFENYNSETGEPLYGKRVEMISWNAACVIDLFLQLYQVDDRLDANLAAGPAGDGNGLSRNLSITKYIHKE
jgi:glycogen debranching enzyme